MASYGAEERRAMKKMDTSLRRQKAKQAATLNAEEKEVTGKKNVKKNQTIHQPSPCQARPARQFTYIILFHPPGN